MEEGEKVNKTQSSIVFAYQPSTKSRFLWTTLYVVKDYIDFQQKRMIMCQSGQQKKEQSLLSIALFRQSVVLNVSVKVVQLVSESTAHCLDVIFVICGMSPCTMLRRLTILDPEPRSSLRVSTTLERRLSLPACLLTAALHHEGSMDGRTWRQTINKQLVQKRRKPNVKLIYFQKFSPQQFPGSII